MSILGADGDRLRLLLERGPLRVRMSTRVRTGWMPIPHLVGELAGRGEDRFLLLSGHVDAWHYGAMDNGTANATMLEVARLLAARRDALRRGIRFAFAARPALEEILLSHRDHRSRAARGTRYPGGRACA